MDEITNSNNVEVFLRMCNEKRPPALLYTEEEKKSSSSSKVLKPQEVIATVSKQLRDIQKADIVTKRCATRVKPRQSHFMPINVLYNQEGLPHQDNNKFETQCVTDTQLIDIANSVEAMVDVNVPMPQKKQITFGDTDCNLKQETSRGGIETICSVNYNDITKAHCSRDIGDIEHCCDQDVKLCTNMVNTEIYKEFDTSHSETQDKKPAKPYNTVNRIQNCYAGSCKSDKVKTTENSTGGLCIQGSSSSLSNIKETEDELFIEKSHKIYYIRNDIGEEASTHSNEEDYLQLKDSPLHNHHKYLTSENDYSLPEKMERSSSPILQSYKPIVKTKTLTPLIYPLETFEKFESLAMPIIEENMDFETAKHLINSQIIDKQLIISTNTVPFLKKSTENLQCKANNCDSENIPDKDDNEESFKSKQISSKSSNIEDEILFSSDEENEYFHCSRVDIPLTCALKTSFYGPDIDLDETIFVGFQTSSDKCIQVSKDSFVKAQKLFESIDKNKNDDLTLTELVHIYDNKGSHLDNNVPIKGVCKTTSLHTDYVKTLEEEEFIGFKTANGKSISISDKAFLKCNTVFKDIAVDIGDTGDALDQSLEKHMENSDLELIQSVKDQSIPMCDNLTTNVISDVNDHYVNLEDQTFLQEFENESIEEAIHNQIECNDLQNFVVQSSDNLLNNKDFVNDSELSEKFDPGIFKDPNKTKSEAFKYFGFKTANNVKIKVSNEALTKTKDLFHDIRFEDMSKYERKTDNECESNYIDENVMKSATLNCNSELKSCQAENEDLQPIFQGFKTASNKNVRISKEALSKSKKIFQDIDSISYKDDLLTITDGRSGKSLNKDDNCRNSFSFQGFKTASNKIVNVSEEAVAKTKSVFLDLIECDIHDNIDKPSHLIHGITKNVENAKIVSDFKIDPVLSGFKTANNKPVIISDEAVSRTRHFFEEIDDIGNNMNSLFKTGESMNLHDTCKKSDKNKLIGNSTRDISGFPTFKTASNKQVGISEDAIAKAKLVFKDLDCENNTSVMKNKIEKDNDWETTVKYIPKETAELTRQEPNQSKSTFKGFQTASNKCVKVSDEALARSRKLFEEIDFDVHNNKVQFKRDDSVDNENMNKENLENDCDRGNVLLGFKAVSKKTNIVAKDTVNKSKLFSDNNLKTVNKNISDLKCKENLAIDTENNKILQNIDTQLLNNFEETLYTEDFYKDITLKQCKRSGSPILSCSKAKRRKKFETPYRMDTNTTHIEKVLSKTNKKLDAKNVFSKNYKTNKLYNLKDLDKIDDKKLNVTVDPYILNFDFERLLEFEFEGIRNDFKDVKWTTDNIKTCFIESVDSKIIPDGWLDNHLKLIIWKLISYEIRFPNVMQNVCTVKNILDQLKYRYDKELYHVERPALRKLLEKDDISTKTMILAVVGVYDNGVKVTGINNPSTNVELLLTDGWYCVKACTDRMLTRLVSEGKITVGRKIAVVGAELLNCEQGVSPWENTSAVRLKIFGNSTRPARWDAKLGFHANRTIMAKLSTIDPSGGKVYKTHALIVRVYPALYVEKLEDGSTVTRSERLEHLHQVKYESERQIRLEKLYEEVEKEFLDQESSGSEGMDTDLKRSHQNASQLNRLMKKSNDPSQFRSHLTDSEALLLQEYSSRKKEKIIEEMQKRVQDRVQAQGLQLGRNVIPLLKIRIAGLDGQENVKVTKAMVSIWRPNDAILDIIKEGMWIDMFNVVPTAVRNSEVQISAGRQSVFHRSEYKEKDKMIPFIKSLQRKCFTTNSLNKMPTMQTDFNEIDSVGIVFLIEPSFKDFESTKGQQFQNVYLTDLDKNFICINFWGGIKKFGYENIFDTGNIVACMNLQKRAGNTRKTIPHFRATELSVFTKTPKLVNLRNMIEELTKNLSGLDKRNFYDDCVSIKNNYAIIKQGSEYSPYRFNTSDYNLTKNKMFIDSPLVQNKDVNLNLSGLDFESTFQQSDTQNVSPALLKRKQLAKAKIARLEMYGEPPPLSKIHILNKSKNAGSAYKSPLTSNVASIKKSDKTPVTTSNLLQSSPVLSMNRTYIVKSVMNPVKLNFSSTSVGDEKTDLNPFEEEFEVSPPLSLE